MPLRGSPHGEVNQQDCSQRRPAEPCHTVDVSIATLSQGGEECCPQLPEVMLPRVGVADLELVIFSTRYERAFSNVVNPYL